jgi:hypothetical protein
MSRAKNGIKSQQWTRHVRTLHKSSAEYMKENKQNKLIAKHLKVNIIVQEQAGAMEKVIATSTETHFHRMETLIKSTMNAMKEMILLIKNNKHPTNSISQTNKTKKKKRDKKCKKKMHQSASTVARNIHQKTKMNAWS